MPDLNLCLVQSDLLWEDIEANLVAFDKKLDKVSDEADIIILPEMFSTGFTMRAAPLAEKPGGPTLRWMREQAAAKRADMAGSFIVEDNGRYLNRLHWVKPDGKVFIYDKRHLFRMAGEHKIYSGGRERVIIEKKGWKIMPFICYDLRFPVWSRLREKEADVLIYIANWPERRSSHWRLLLQARAVENQAYVAGVNRCGRDGLEIDYRGESAVFDPLGRALTEAAENEERLLYATLSRARQERYREKFPVWKDADIFEIKETHNRNSDSD